MDEEKEINESERQARLDISRAEAQKKKLKIASRLKKAAVTVSINSTELILACGVALIFDFTSIIPFVGQLTSIFASGTLWFWIKMKTLGKKQPWFIIWGPAMVGFVKILPFEINAIPPLYLFDVMLFAAMNSQAGRKFTSLVSSS